MCTCVGVVVVICDSSFWSCILAAAHGFRLFPEIQEVLSMPSWLQAEHCYWSRIVGGKLSTCSYIRKWNQSISRCKNMVFLETACWVHICLIRETCFERSVWQFHLFNLSFQQFYQNLFDISFILLMAVEQGSEDFLTNLIKNSNHY